MAVVVQYVVKPNPGSDLGGIIELAKESAVLWRKHGGKPRFWSVAVGEAGNYVFSINFETFSAYGAAVDKLNADPARPRRERVLVRTQQSRFAVCDPAETQRLLANLSSLSLRPKKRGPFHLVPV